MSLGQSVSFNLDDGKIFVDGSGWNPTSTVPRAGWAAVQIDADGAVLKALWGTVPPGKVQHANMAEHMALCKAANGAAAPGMEVVSDCQGVVDLHAKGRVWALGPKRLYAGLYKESSVLWTEAGPSAVSTGWRGKPCTWPEGTLLLTRMLTGALLPMNSTALEVRR